MKTFFLLVMLFSTQLFAWELPNVKDADAIRYLHERQEILVRNFKGVWRFDVNGILVSAPSRSTQLLWDRSLGKSPASLSVVHAIYAPTTGVVFMLVPESENVQVLKLR